MRLSVATFALLVVLAPPLSAQKKAAPPTLTAEALAKECAADGPKAEAKYKGGTLRVSGKVGDIYEEILYLPTDVKIDGTPASICLRFDPKMKPKVKTGETATFEGEFTLIAVLGPSLKDVKLVPAEKTK